MINIAYYLKLFQSISQAAQIAKAATPIISSLIDAADDTLKGAPGSQKLQFVVNGARKALKHVDDIGDKVDKNLPAFTAAVSTIADIQKARKQTDSPINTLETNGN